MSKWRPDDWDNPFSEGGKLYYDSCAAIRENTYEVGADAMLEALEEQGGVQGIKDGKQGLWVFIPDEEKDG